MRVMPGIEISTFGRISLENVKGEFEANTSNGDIGFRGEMTAGGMNQLTTSNGSMEVTLLGEPSVKLDATTSNGEIICKLPIMEMETEVKRLVGVVGGGDTVLCQSQRQERRQTENPHRQITEYCSVSLR